MACVSGRKQIMLNLPDSGEIDTIELPGYKSDQDREILNLTYTQWLRMQAQAERVVELAENYASDARKPSRYKNHLVQPFAPTPLSRSAVYTFTLAQKIFCWVLAISYGVGLIFYSSLSLQIVVGAATIS